MKCSKHRANLFMYFLSVISLLLPSRTDHSHSIRFAWWGQRGASQQLSVPWKAGMTSEEAIFPLRSDKQSVNQYLADTGSLELEILDNNGHKIGRAALPLAQLLVANTVEPDLTFTDAKRNPLGYVSITVGTAFTCHYNLPQD